MEVITLDWHSLLHMFSPFLTSGLIAEISVLLYRHQLHSLQKAIRSGSKYPLCSPSLISSSKQAINSGLLVALNPTGAHQIHANPLLHHRTGGRGGQSEP